MIWISRRDFLKVLRVCVVSATYFLHDQIIDTVVLSQCKLSAAPGTLI